MTIAAFSNAAKSKSRRRWYQFSLRTLLIAVVLPGAACGYVGHEYRIVQERRRFLDEESPVDADPSPAANVSWVRRLLGDEGYSRIAIDEDSDIAKRQLVATLFPEAQVMAFTLLRHPEISLDNFSVEYEAFPDEVQSPPQSSGHP